MSRQMRDGARRNLDTPEAVAMRKKIADGLDFTAPVVASIRVGVRVPEGHKGNLHTWMYETLVRLSNKYQMQEAEYNELLALAERAYDDGFDEGQSWGYEEGQAGE
jgi:hypothetical protein